MYGISDSGRFHKKEPVCGGDCRLPLLGSADADYTETADNNEVGDEL